MKKHQFLDDLFRDDLQKKFEKVAVVFDNYASAAKQLTYMQVNENAIQISTMLKNYSAHDEIIGCSSETDLLTPCLVLGILRVPSAFCFLDPRSPTDFILKILSSVGIGLIVEINTHKFKRYGEIVVELQIEEGTVFLIEISGEHRKKDYFPDWRLAYAVHTSGTTGAPKTVRVPHRCILPNVQHLKEFYKMSHRDVVFISSPFTFDPSIVDLFIAFSCGASVLLVPDMLKASPGKLADVLTNRHSVTYIQSTPSLMHSFTPERLKTSLLSPTSMLRILSLGGEKCPNTTILSSWKDPKNKTQICNIYGITEVSSWASVQAISEEDLKKDNFEIGLGTALAATVLEVLDEDGDVTCCGEGELFIGGQERICLIGWENYDVIPKSPMRASGDWVKVYPDGHLDFIGRKDDQIKRFGKKFHLTAIEECLLHCHLVQNAAAIWKDNKILKVYVMLKDGTADDSTVEVIMNTMKDRLPSYMVPNDISIVIHFPLTPHGKLDKRKLIEMGDSRKCEPLIDSEATQQFITKLWEDITFTPASNTVNFVDAGGDSVRAVHFCEMVECRTHKHLPMLLDILLNWTFAEVCSYVHSNVIGTNLVPILEDGTTKFYQTDVEVSQNLILVKERCQHARVYSRGGIITSCNCEDGIQSENISISNETDTQMDITVEWKYNLGKCIDASPLVIVNDKKSIVYVGSHSRKFVAVSVDCGEKIWEIEVGDRIESCACSSACGNFLYFGCYDHKLYCVESQSGHIDWTYSTGEIIKSSPVYCKKGKSVIFGCHDNHIYSLAYKDGVCLWKMNFNSGSIFSTICVYEETSTIYIASLGGKIASLNAETGEIQWTLEVEKPVFSSPTLLKNGFCVGCIDGNLHAFSHSGEKIWSFESGSPIFSSPCQCTTISSANLSVTIVGSHDCHVYCIEEVSGKLIWKFMLDSAVYSTAFPCHELCVKDAKVVTCSTKGTMYILSLRNGNLLAKLSVGGEIFSSPVVVESRIIVGCRDNNLYCFKVLS